MIGVYVSLQVRGTKRRDTKKGIRAIDCGKAPPRVIEKRPTSSMQRKFYNHLLLGVDMYTMLVKAQDRARRRHVAHPYDICETGEHLKTSQSPMFGALFGLPAKTHRIR